ncbi:MAG: ACT domain-containing protein [Acidimicrobiia bacterium]
MTEFVVRMDNRPGRLASLAEVLAQAGVNIEALTAFGFDGEGLIRIIVDDADGARRALNSAGVMADEFQVLKAVVPNSPGEFASIARSLADANINIDAVYTLHSTPAETEFAIVVDEPEGALPYLPVQGSLNR